MKKPAKKLTLKEIQALHVACAKNLATYPAICTELSKQLGVSCVSLTMAEAGYYPLQGCWTFPERNEDGEVIGISTRTMGGKKFMIPGSKHGLFYMVNQESEASKYEEWGWQRTDTDHPCKLCGKPDGCLYPKGDYENPAAITCRVVHDGATVRSETEFGTFHVMDQVRNDARMMNRSLLLPTNHPYLIVEGASDMCAAFDLGFVGVGRPNNDAKLDVLQHLMHGKPVCIIGENDKGAGVTGMEKTFVKLYDTCHPCTKVLPIPEVKDLRQWKKAGLTQAMLLQHIAQSGDTSLDPNVFPSDDPVLITDEWLKREKTTRGVLTLRVFNDDAMDFDGLRYCPISAPELRDQIQTFLRGKAYVNWEDKIKAYKNTDKNRKEIASACGERCRIKGKPPMWLADSETLPDARRMIAFRNGILDVDKYLQGEISLMNPDPRLFTFSALPYDFDENAESPRCEDFYADIFNAVADKIRLLQQWSGYNLTHDMSKEKLMMLQGKSRSGKGVCFTTLQALLGNEINCAITSFGAMDSKYPFTQFNHKLSGMISEAKIQNVKAMEGILNDLLRLVGRDIVELTRKYHDTEGFKELYTRFTLAMNEFPPFIDNTLSLENRTCVLMFTNSYAGREDETLKTKLPEEALSGKLINWALRGLKDLHDSGNKFVIPEESARSLKAFRALMSPVVAFSDMCIEDCPGNFVDNGMLYEYWQWWCRRDGHRRCDRKEVFINMLISARSGSHVLDPGERGNRDRAVSDIRLTDWAVTELNKG